MSLINLGIARNQGNCPYYSVSLSMLVQMIESYRLGLYGDLFITPSWQQQYDIAVLYTLLQIVINIVFGSKLFMFIDLTCL